MNIVPLLESLANEILAAEELFLKNPKDFHLLASGDFNHPKSIYFNHSESKINNHKRSN